MENRNLMMTPQQVADLLKVDRSTVKRWCREKRLASLLINPRVRRIRHADLETFLNQAQREDRDRC